MENIIEFSHVSKHFGAIKALRDVSFTIRKGECHAIIGENGAGKSTLMNILSGIYLPDGGNVLYKGEPVKISAPHVAGELGISTVYQELKLCPNLTITENIFLGRTKTTRLGVIQKGDMDEQARQMMEMFHIDLDVTQAVSRLSIAQMQLVELAKAIGKNADVLILDEPTSSLTAAETQTLFTVLERLKKEGRTLLFISHRLSEIFAIADRLSVMRDGAYLGTYDCGEIDENKVVKLITGNELYEELSGEQDEAGTAGGKQDVVLEVKNLNRGKLVRDVSFRLYEGEILGLYGLQGSGRTELVETVFGLHPAESGEIVLRGEVQKKGIRSPGQAIRCEMGLLTEDRKNRGIFAKMDILENIAVIHNKKICGRFGILSRRKMEGMAQEYCRKLSVKMDSLQQNIQNLSGGNQQKVIIARMLSTDPGIILADEPTRGVDVGAKSEIFAIFHQLKKDKKSIILISSELKEVVKECDRVLVMRNGRIVGEVTDRENREEQILQYSFNG